MGWSAAMLEVGRVEGGEGPALEARPAWHSTLHSIKALNGVPAS